MIGAIVQARMTSSRLPGKVLMTVQGKPIIEYLITQLQRVQKLEIIILATTTNSEDDPLVKFAEKNQISTFRGSENDVLERYYQVAKKYKLEHILRITGDCPLLDPFICDRIIDVYFDEQADLVGTGPTYAEGLDCEIFSLLALTDAFQGAKLKSEREHVSLFLHNRKDHYKVIEVENETDDSKYRFTLDEPEDFQVIEAIINGITLESSEIFSAEKVKSFLDQNPEISLINKNIFRNEGLSKSLNNDEVIESPY